MRRLIGFAKHHKYDKKQAAFKEDQKDRKRTRNGRRQTSETSQIAPDINKNCAIDRAVNKITEAVA